MEESIRWKSWRYSNTTLTNLAEDPNVAIIYAQLDCEHAVERFKGDFVERCRSAIRVQIGAHGYGVLRVYSDQGDL